jgi:hypothetical protein
MNVALSNFSNGVLAGTLRVRTGLSMTFVTAELPLSTHCGHSARVRFRPKADILTSRRLDIPVGQEEVTELGGIGPKHLC